MRVREREDRPKIERKSERERKRMRERGREGGGAMEGDARERDS